MQVPTSQSLSSSRRDFYYQIARYIVAQKTESEQFVISNEAAEMYESFLSYLEKYDGLDRFRSSVAKLRDRPVVQFRLIRQWLKAFVRHIHVEHYTPWINEVVVLLQVDNFEKERIVHATTTKVLQPFHGEHANIQSDKYQLDYVRFMSKMQTFVTQHVPKFEQFQQRKKELVAAYKQQMRLREFQPRVLSSFVRNQLIDQVYLPLIGNNLAKQIGTAGTQTRTDRMGLLLLISPPGYGKTTLMEYEIGRAHV